MFLKKIFNNPNQREIILKALVSLFLRGGGYGFGFLFIWLIAQNLGASIQGIFAIAFLFLSVGSMVGKFGLSTAIVKWIASHPNFEERRIIIIKCLGIVFLFSAVLALVIFFGSTTIAFFYKKPEIVTSIKIAAITIPIFSIIEIGSAVFKGTKQLAIFSIYFDFLKFLLPAVVFSILYFVFSVSVIELPIFSYLAGYSLLLIIILIHLQLRFKIFISKKRQVTFLPVKKMLKDSYPMLMASSIVMIMGWSDVFILGFFVDEADIGVYSTAVRIATLVSFTYTAIAAIMTPKIAEYFHANNHQDFKATIAFSSKLMFFCSLPIFLLLFVFSEFFLSIFGEIYKEGSIVLKILLLAQFTNVITGPVGPIFQMTGLQHTLQRFLVLSLMVNLIFSVVLVYSLKLEGVAIGSALGMICWNLLGAIYLKKKRRLVTWINFSR